MDRIRITGLTLSALIGVHPWERHVRQTIRIDIEFDVDASKPAASDDLVDAVDYGAVARRVTDIADAARFGLIETLAERVADCILTEFSVPRVKVVLHKPNAIPSAHDTSLEIERHRS